MVRILAMFQARAAAPRRDEFSRPTGGVGVSSYAMTPAGIAVQPAVSNSTATEPRSVSVGRQLLERFALIAFGLYHLPLFLNNYPTLGGGGFSQDGLAVQWGHVFTVPGIWIARHLFHITGPMPQGSAGDNGDVSEEYARLLLCVALGIAGAIAWTIADRHRPPREWMESALRILLRYSIALGLIGYAVAKLFPQQFPPITASVLERRVGDLTPMSLLWTFMQYSRAYAFFGGLVELIAVVLLCYRPTATLGALVCLAAMTNVALLNYAYGVPVKLYATMMVLSAAVLVLYDWRRVFDGFVRNRAVDASRESTVVQDLVPARWRQAIKIVMVGSVMLSSVVAMAPTLRPTPAPAVEGTWSVSAGSPSMPWRRMTVDVIGVTISTSGDALLRCRRARPADTTALLLQCAEGHGGELRSTREGNTLHLEGTFDGAPVNVTATYVDRASYRLLRTPFRWIFD